MMLAPLTVGSLTVYWMTLLYMAALPAESGAKMKSPGSQRCRHCRFNPGRWGKGPLPVGWERRLSARRSRTAKPSSGATIRLHGFPPVTELSGCYLIIRSVTAGFGGISFVNGFAGSSIVVNILHQADNLFFGQEKEGNIHNHEHRSPPDARVHDPY